MAMRAFYHFEKSKNQFQLIRHFIHDTTLVLVYKLAKNFYNLCICSESTGCKACEAAKNGVYYS
jgi:hypothetical protein